MKKKTTRRLSLGKIKIASLNNASQSALKGGDISLISCVNCGSIKFACPSQGAPVCSEDSCRV